MRRSIIFGGLVYSLMAAMSVNATPVSYGDLTGGGAFSGTTSSNSAWAQENPASGDEINFWTFSANVGDTISIVVNSLPNLDGFYDLNAAFSLYSGVVDSSTFYLSNFSNTSSFATADFITGTPVWGTAGNNASLTDIVLAKAGTYTLAIGGENGFSFDDDYDYELNFSQVAVPAPASLGLLVAGLAGIGLRRRQNKS
ncbi:MAG: PEP-CTERM sorting domain-containing protein [Spongiibacteraceae bacterium]